MINEPVSIPVSSNLKLKALIKENGSPYWIVVTHGLGEHKNRHEYFFKYFSQYFNVCLYDLRGHGESEGQRANVERFESYAEDLSHVLGHLKQQYSMQKFILFGHSMGAMIVADFMQNFVNKDFYPEKVFLSAPPVAAPGVLGDIFQYVPKLATHLMKDLPSFPLKGVLNLKYLSHDPRVLEAYINDPLVSLKIHTRLMLGVVDRAKEIFARPLRVDCPLFVSVGTADGIINPKALIHYFKNVEKNASLLIVEGAYHEMHNEIEKYRSIYLDFLTKSLMSSIYSA